jgi:hypothetical protein
MTPPHAFDADVPLSQWMNLHGYESAEKCFEDKMVDQKDAAAKVPPNESVNPSYPAFKN